MTETNNNNPPPWSRPSELLYGAALFGGALAALAIAWPGSAVAAHDWHTALFVLAFGLFTISIGYEHPHLGYVSFDRVAQVASILVLGPVDAAWINGLASLVYPWHRLRKGVPLRAVINASLMNAGLMSLMILAAGLLYQSLGGAVPLDAIEPASFAAVLVLLVAMQLINEAGMLALKRFAEMRQRLERLVGERTAALQDKTRQLERLASLDTLTGLHNRRHADAFLDLALESAAREDVALTVALADVDHFKQINDGHSHAVGDQVLERVAQVLADRMRASDLVARYGGEEFLFCLVGMDEPRAAEFCEELRLAVERHPWEDLSPGLQVTTSIGLAERREESTVKALLERADACLYEAKRLGRNRVVTCRERTPGVA